MTALWEKRGPAGLILFGKGEFDGAGRPTASAGDRHVVGVVFAIRGERPDIVKLSAVRHGGVDGENVAFHLACGFRARPHPGVHADSLPSVGYLRMMVSSGPPLRPGCNSVMTITLPSSASLRVIVGVPGSLFQFPTKPCGPCAKTGRAIIRKIAKYISRFMVVLLD